MNMENKEGKVFTDAEYLRGMAETSEREIGHTQEGREHARRLRSMAGALDALDGPIPQLEAFGIDGDGTMRKMLAEYDEDKMRLLAKHHPTSIVRILFEMLADCKRALSEASLSLEAEKGISELRREDAERFKRERDEAQRRGAAALIEHEAELRSIAAYAERLAALLERFAEFERDSAGYCEWCGSVHDQEHSRDCIYLEVRAALAKNPAPPQHRTGEKSAGDSD